MSQMLWNRPSVRSFLYLGSLSPGCLLFIITHQFVSVTDGCAHRRPQAIRQIIERLIVLPALYRPNMTLAICRMWCHIFIYLHFLKALLNFSCRYFFMRNVKKYRFIHLHNYSVGAHFMYLII